ncbi:MAG: type III polyketide synthase [Bacteroidota bacterium]
MPAFIRALGTALPTHRIAQSDIVEFMIRAHGLDIEAAHRLRVLYRASGIQYRHSVLADYGGESDFFSAREDLEPFPTTAQRMKRYEEEALPLAIEALQKARPATQDWADITHLITVSCTGMYAPGLGIDLIQALGMRPSVQRTAINFMGCYGAVIGLRTAADICKAHPDAQVLVVCVELCTLHIQQEADPDTLLAQALFGDGAGAAWVSPEPGEGLNLALDHFATDLAVSGYDEMAWHIRDHGFVMRLSAEVPGIIRAGIEELTHRLLATREWQKPPLWAIHPGGKRILQVIGEALGIPRSEMEASYAIMRNYGNMSSTTLLFVLAHLWESLADKDAGRPVIGLAFGPGLTMESMQLRVHVSDQAPIQASYAIPQSQPAV